MGIGMLGHPRPELVHQVGKARAGHAGLDLVGVENAFLDLVQQLDRLTHFLAVAHGDDGSDAGRQGC